MWPHVVSKVDPLDGNKASHVCIYNISSIRDTLRLLNVDFIIIYILFERVLDRWVPNSWQDTLRAFKEAATYKDDCKKQFPCSNPQE